MSKDELEALVDAQVRQALAEYEVDQIVAQNRPIDPYAEEHRAWAVAEGLTDGTRPKGPALRQELWTMLHRLIQRLEKV